MLTQKLPGFSESYCVKDLIKTSDERMEIDTIINQVFWCRFAAVDNCRLEIWSHSNGYRKATV